MQQRKIKSFLLFLIFFITGFFVSPAFASNPNLLTDPGLENWSGGSLVSWGTFTGGPGTASFVQETTKVHGGSSAVKITGAASTSGYITQKVAGLTSGTSYVVSFWAEGDTGVGEDSSLIIFNSDRSQAWNFSGAASGTWTAFTGTPTSDQFTMHSLTTSYQSVSNVVIPNSDTIEILVGGGASGTTNYIDDLALKLEFEPYDGNLPVVGTSQKNKLSFINGVYYLSFTSSTSSGLYDIYMTTSTNGVLGTWSRPHVISSDNDRLDDVTGPIIYDLEYDSGANLFGLAYIASSTPAIYFSTSTDAYTWSNPVTVVSSLHDTLDLSLSNNKAFIAAGESSATDHILKSFYSSNYGTTWGSGVTVYSRNVSGASGNPSATVFDSAIGSDDSFHTAYLDGGDGGAVSNILIYASSTDSGASWTTTSIGQDISTNSLNIDAGALALDSSNLPGVLFYKVNSVTGSGPFDVTLTALLNKKDSLGTWTTSTVGSTITAAGVSGTPVKSQLIYSDTDHPLAFYFGNSLYPTNAASTSTVPYTFQVSQVASVAIGKYTSLGFIYSTSTAIAGFSYADASGQLYFATSSISLATVSLPAAPASLTATAVSSSQINLSWTAVSGATSYKVYRSTDSYTTAIATPGTNSYSDTSLSANTTYSYKVSAVNGDGEGSKSSTASATTEAAVVVQTGGGGGGSTGPYNISVVINSSATSTTNPTVSLTLNAANVSDMLISDNSLFTGAVWENFQNSRSWTFSSATGTKTIYVKYRDTNGISSSVVSSSITLLETAIPVTQVIVPSTVVITTPPPVVEIVTPIITPVVSPVLLVVNPESKIIVSNVNTLSLQPATNLKFNYTYTNEQEKTMHVRFVRQTLNNKGTILASSRGYYTLDPAEVASVSVNQLIGRYWTPGEYTTRIRVYNMQGQIIDENSFTFIVEKYKYKYLINGVLGENNAFIFDQDVWNKNKFDVRLPTVLRIKYSYTNQTSSLQDIRMVRELIDSTGKVWQTRRGRWKMIPGETYALTVTQSIISALPPDVYLVRLRALDYKTGDILAENSLTFSIELK